MLDDFKLWVRQPFSADMDAAHWFYFIGLLLVISFLWGLVLHTIQEAQS